MEKLRNELDSKYMWDLSSLFASDDEFKKVYKEVEKRLNDVEEVTVKTSDDFYNLATLFEELAKQTERISVYATMKSHEDGNIAFYQGLRTNADSLSVLFSTKYAFLEPMLSELSDTVISNILADDRLSHYAFYFENLKRQKPYILSKETEEILSKSTEMASTAYNAFTLLSDVDSDFGEIINEDGQLITVTHGNYKTLLGNKNRQVRQDAYYALSSYYVKNKNTFASLYQSNIKKDAFYCKVRNHKSTLEQSLFDDNIPLDVYKSLIEAVHSYTPDMHKYLEKRRQILGVDQLHFYDLYVSCVDDIDDNIEYEKAWEKILKSTEVLGDEYKEILLKAKNDKWIDVYENKGKESGAYSWGAYTSNPYILLNYDNKSYDMFTLAHELGHSVHSYLTRHNQPYVYGNYTTLIAEIASTFNECLLMDYLLQNSETDKETRFLINEFLEQVRGTIFRQTLFAEFEMITHNMYQEGTALTVDVLSETYGDLLRKYYGENIVIDEYIKMEWSRLPHLYMNFYVFQYSTGLSAGIAFNNLIKEQGQTAVDKYINLLKSGDSDYATNLLKEAGVDLTTPYAVSLALDTFRELVDKF